MTHSLETSPYTVDVLMVTCNHEKYIKQAVESVLSQKTIFNFRIVIGDDASDDATSLLLSDLSAMHSSKLSVKRHPERVGVFANFLDAYNRCSAEYIAFLDGDDYWIDDEKLQKQINVFKSNPDVVLCAHNFRYLQNELLLASRTNLKSSYTTSEIIAHNPFTTSSVVIRREKIPTIPEWFSKSELIDWPLWVLASTYGRIAVLQEEMSVYRLHAKGVWTKKSDPERLKLLENTFKMFLAHNPSLALPIGKQLKRIKTRLLTSEAKTRKLTLPLFFDTVINHGSFVSIFILLKQLRAKARIKRIANAVKTAAKILPGRILGSRYCPSCNHRSFKFKPFFENNKSFVEELVENGFTRHRLEHMEFLNLSEYSCVNCKATDRDRGICFYLSTLGNTSKTSKVLEIGPGGVLTAFLGSSFKTNLETLDISVGKATHTQDIQNMKGMMGCTYDIIICSHVLEHVSNDVKAIKEICRILQDKGLVIFLVPIDKHQTHIDENPYCVDERERIKRFGQADHVRMYSSSGFVTRLKMGGFNVEKVRLSSLATNHQMIKMGIDSGSALYIGKKAQA